ncbi:MAG: phosphate signaling complex protein PhoU [Ignavibacteriaceae bacterium]|nr:phosphate signaling complex protein PhoU [Ignavibacteriaceae bacterium]
MERHFEKEFDELKITINKMASIVDEQVENSFKDMEDAGVRLYKEVKQRDREVDAYDNLIMAQCENLLALYQPVATDLRFILTAIKIDSQLERCGDIAVNIVQRVKKTDNFRELITQTDLPEMGRTARIMVKDAITAFINRDSELAKSIWAKDEIVDSFNKKIFNQLVEIIKAKPDLAEACAHLIVLTRQIERLADHATNISEDVIFLTENEIVSHKKKLENYKLPE